jgi:hypothetical protein
MIKQFILSFFMFSFALHGAPVGNTSTPKVIEKGLFTQSADWLDVRMGYEGDFVADGRMNQYDQGTGRVDTYEQWSNTGTFTLNLVKRIDVYGVLGASKTKADWRFSNSNAGTINRAKIETEDNLMWAVGSRAILYEWWNASLGLGGRYSACSYQPNQLSVDGVMQSTSHSHFEWWQWQINMDLSYKISWFIPYVGAKYSQERALLTDFSVPISGSLSPSNSFKNRDYLGFYLGCTLSNGHYFMLNLEGRVIDEEAISLSCDFRF